MVIEKDILIGFLVIKIRLIHVKIFSVQKMEAIVTFRVCLNNGSKLIMIIIIIITIIIIKCTIIIKWFIS